ncbi:hypothetical protein A2U01_0005628 [Trifolium medium]|uniref:Uncharacterized protein n=1 Tax=Trifolium medium TaxID=97028 RepID=A0A392MBB7_9FABA|nr:hypothetical protein [Trifolium medium]
MELVENSEEQDEESVYSEETCIPESVASMEDEETLKKIENNYEKLVGEAEMAAALNEEEGEKIQNWHENNERAVEEWGKEKSHGEYEIALNDIGPGERNVNCEEINEEFVINRIEEGGGYVEVETNSGNDKSKENNVRNENESGPAMESPKSQFKSQEAQCPTSSKKSDEELNNNIGPEKEIDPITMEESRTSPSLVAEGRIETVTKKMETVCGDEETTHHIVKDGEEQTGEAIIGRCPANGSS